METNDPKYKHKPSEKHTLEEVLKSLQDLIRNDLDESATAAARAEPAPAAAPGAVSRDENTTGRREDFAPQTPGAGPVNLDAVVRSLKDLIGNELNVGDEPAPESAKSAATHDEYLAADEKIEEYIPEELGQLGDELDIGDELALPEPETPAPTVAPLAPETGIEPAPFADTPPEQVAPLEDEIVMESLPEELTPRNEALTIETPQELAPVEAATPELPGEILSELLNEPELAAPPLALEPAPPTAATGAQQELLLEEPPPIELRMPPSPEIVPTPEPVTALSEATPPPVAEEKPEAALPTIEVEKSFDADDHFDAAASTAGTAAAESEAIITFDTEISAPTEAPAESAPVAEAASEAPSAAEPAGQKITLEIVNEPLDDSAQNWASVDFDTLATEPATAEPVSPPASAAAAPPASEVPAPAIEPEPAPPPETAMPPPASESAPPRPAASPPAAARPAPDRARDVVVRAVARLNVEMRKTGGTGLDTKTILRLQQLIRQELEKGGEK